MSHPHETTIAQEAVREELVAYLDGELDAEGVRRVEERLAGDAAYRREMQRLEQAWELLDRLPPTEANASFTQTTIEMVAVAAEAEATSAMKAVRRRRAVNWLAGLATVLLFGVCGYWLVERAVSRKNEALARDLPVIENLDYYLHVDSVEFLRKLDKEGMFGEEVSDGEI